MNAHVLVAAALAGGATWAAMVRSGPWPRLGPGRPPSPGRRGLARPRWRRSKERAATRAAVVELAEGLASELAAGQPVRTALARAGGEVGEPVLAAALAPVVRTAALGGDVPTALAAASRHPDLRPLGWLGAAWQVGEQQGAGLAVAVERVAAAGRAEAEHRLRVASAMAAPRATARLLAMLPLAGVVLGGLLGARPLDVLIGSPVGWGCLAAGAALEVAGLAWMSRIVATASGPPP